MTEFLFLVGAFIRYNEFTRGRCLLTLPSVTLVMMSTATKHLKRAG